MKEDLVKAGYNEFVAEGLAERGHTVETAELLSVREALDEVLEWNGIIGFTSSIVDAIDNLRNMEKD